MLVVFGFAALKEAISFAEGAVTHIVAPPDVDVMPEVGVLEE